jgi:UrcA family protein
MAHLPMRVPMRAGTLFISLFCGVCLTAFPQISGAQNTTIAPPNSPAVSGASPAGSSTEVIEVEVPRLLKFETQPTNGTLQKMSLEGPVRYDDLDLRTDGGVAELRSRIAQESADICGHLAQLYPVYAAAGTSCVKDAIDDANVRANRVITRVRQPSY